MEPSSVHLAVHPAHPDRSTDMNDNIIILLGFLVAANVILITVAVVRVDAAQEPRIASSGVARQRRHAPAGRRRLSRRRSRRRSGAS